MRQSQNGRTWLSYICFAQFRSTNVYGITIFSQWTSIFTNTWYDLSHALSLNFISSDLKANYAVRLRERLMYVLGCTNVLDYSYEPTICIFDIIGNNNV